MCEYCEKIPGYEDCPVAYDVNTGSEALLYQDPVNGAWFFKVTGEDHSKTRICVANCPWCGEKLSD